MKTLGNMASMTLVVIGAMLTNCYVGLMAIAAGGVGTVAFLIQLHISFNPNPAEFVSALIRIMLNSLFPAMLVFALGAGPFLDVIAVSGTLITIGVAGIFLFQDKPEKK